MFCQYMPSLNKLKQNVNIIITVFKSKYVAAFTIQLHQTSDIHWTNNLAIKSATFLCFVVYYLLVLFTWIY